MKTADDRAVEWVDDEAVVLNPETGDLHYLNAQAAIVYALILEHGYEGGLTEARRMFRAERGFEGQLAELLADMVERGLLVDG